MQEYLLKDALKKGYAVGAFNFGTLEVLKGIIASAELAAAPVIAQVSEGAIKFMGEEYLKQIIVAARKECKIPISFHLDHGTSFESVKKAIEIGFDSVMIDASMLPFEDNIAITKNVVDYAHEKGVYVEAELGSLAGVEDNIAVADDKSCFTNPAQAKEFVERTGVDSLAIAIGTKHGAYKFGGEAKLRFDILDEIEKEIPNTPLVLHGASGVDSTAVTRLLELGVDITGAKGIPDEFLQQAAKRHICKINGDTDLRIALLIGILHNVEQNTKNIDYRKYLTEGMAEITALCKGKHEIYGSANQAKLK